MTEIDKSFESTATDDCNNKNCIHESKENRHPLLKRINGRSNSGSSSSTTGGRDFNYCEVYYLSSPSKGIQNKDNPISASAANTKPPAFNSITNPTPSIVMNPGWQDMSWSTEYKCNEKMKNSSRVQENVFSGNISSGNATCGSSYTSGGVSVVNTNNIISCPGNDAKVGSRSCDSNLDNFEIHSHYSDSVATVPVQLCSRTRPGNVTFSNCTQTPPPIGSSLVTTRVLSESISTPGTGTTTERIHSNRGSLRRSKGRSNQSLCSCDAGDTELVPNPNRPLFQYSLDRKNKSHTYTCEQNAQILMRLERERERRKSSITGSGDKTTHSPAIIEKQQSTEGNTIIVNNICDDNYPTIYQDTSNSMESDSTTDVDLIPPPPPPASMNRKNLASMKSLSFNTSNCNSINRTAESMLNDCTSTILNCANISSNHSKENNNCKPDLCCTGKSITISAKGLPDGITLVPTLTSSNGTSNNNSNTNNNNNNNSNSNNNSNNIGFISKKSNNQENIPLTPYPYVKDDSYMTCFKSKNTNNGCDGDTEESVFFYHQEFPQFEPNFENRPYPGKYNTIGPSSCYAKQFALCQNPAGQCNSSLFPSTAINNGDISGRRVGSECDVIMTDSRNLGSSAAGQYFSQSLTNFAVIGNSVALRQGGYNNWRQYHYHPHHHHHHVAHCYPHQGDEDIGPHGVSSNTPYTQFRTQANELSCSFGESTLLDSSYTSIGSSNSGLKGKSQQTQLQQDEHLLHPHHHHQANATSMPWKHRQCPSRGSSSSGTNSLRFDPSKHWLAVSSILLIVGAASVAVPLALRVAASAPFEERLQVATQLLDEVPLIDGHNDLPWNIRKFLHNKLNDFSFDEDLRNVMPWARSHWSHTDLQRLKKGRVAAQFWAAYVPCEAQHRDAVQLTLEQIDVIKRLTERYSPQLTTCTSVSDIIEAHKNHQLCSLTGVEGGHSLGGSLAVLRTLYSIGVRYMTLTSTCHTPWADSSYADAPTYNVKHGGLTVFGKTIIREMNRLGMIVDLSHVSTGTMRDALATSEAPVIFSHSSAYELCNSSRNVQDEILQSIAKNGGLVMVNFYSKFLSCSENSTVHDAVAHINHIKRVAGIDHVGLGAGFDGINFTPKGLEDVSTYPTLFAELLGEGWSIEDLTKLAGQNFLRVMGEVEKIRDAKKLAGVRPYEDHPNFRTEDPYNCTSS